ncbi:MAG TPA: cyanoexosortase B system-associated protein [Trichocoleus sp.]
MPSQSISTDKTLHRWLKVFLVAGLAAIALITALPNLVSGQWPWVNPPQVENIRAIRALRQQGLALSGWDAASSQTININGHDWLLSEYRASQSGTDSPNGQPGSAPESSLGGALDTFVLLLRAQPDHADQPALEWVDLAGAQSWNLDSRRTLTFAVDHPQQPGQQVTVKALYRRAWNPQQTFALLQWYAWPRAGNFSPNRWFWADQGAQWRSSQRMPWVAVSLLLPTAPLADIGPYEQQAMSIGQQIQTELLREPLATMP